MVRTLIALLFGPCLLLAQQITFTSLPRQCQLYARDAADSAAVSIAGTIATPGIDSASVTIYRNGSPFSRKAQALVYVNGSASVALTPKIHSELANYKFEVRVGSTLVTSVDSVVCGDVYLIDGQSNAVAWIAWSYTSPWVRSFGNTVPGQTADTAWGVGQCQTWDDGGAASNGHLAVSVWGMELAKSIVDNQHIPVCIINVAVGGTVITDHFKSFNWIYTAAIYRMTKAGLMNSLKAIFWHQGEQDCMIDTLWPNYTPHFLTLYNSWKADYPSLKRIYEFQIRLGNCWRQHADVIGESQRTLPQSHSDISAVSTADLAGNDGCHYTVAGYQGMGDRLYRLVARDFYNSTDTANIRPPNIVGAWFMDGTRTKLVLQFDGSVLLPATGSITGGFSIDNAIGLVDSVRADTALRRLILSVHGASSAKVVSYLSDESSPGGPYPGPWLTNPRGVGPLMFHKFPIGSMPTAARRTLAPLAGKVPPAAHGYTHAVTSAGLVIWDRAAGIGRAAVYTIRGQRFARLLLASK